MAVQPDRVSGPSTATWSRPGSSTPKTTYTATALGVDGSRGWRTSRRVRVLDDTYGTVNWTQDDGDITTTGDEKCITYTYNRNLDKNLTETVRQTTATALPCGAAPASVDDVISDARVYYDGATSPDTAPVYGSVTKTEQLKDWAPGRPARCGRPSRRPATTPAGRLATATDIRGNVTTTGYTPSAGGPGDQDRQHHGERAGTGRPAPRSARTGDRSPRR